MNVRPSEHADNIWIVEPSGRIDAERAPEMDTQLQALLSVGNARLVVDFTQVSYISSSGLKALLVALRGARQAGGDLKLCGMNERVRDVFDLSGFDKVFAIYRSEDEAVAAFDRSRTELQ